MSEEELLYLSGRGGIDVLRVGTVLGGPLQKDPFHLSFQNMRKREKEKKRKREKERIRRCEGG
jgi:hypothetical protein